MAKTEFTVDRDKLEVRMTRVFDASRERLWQAVTDPAQIPQWWGPAMYTTTIEKDEVKVGGAWRYIQKDAEGKEFAFRGEYKEIVEPERVTRTFEFEPMAGHILTETMTLEELEDGKTKVTAISHYANLEDLDGMVASGMEGGAIEGWERLAGLVERVEKV